MNGLTIAIVGAGASGCYVAQALRKAFPEAEICVLERLPVPFGLLRYGVAADHQGTKGVQHQFEHMFEHSHVHFHGGVELGRDIDLHRLTDLFDVVVLATGLCEDRRLNVEGDTLGGVVGAGAFTRALNSHPECQAALPSISSRIAIVGLGNVAVDVLRLVSKDEDEWDGSDMDPAVLSEIIPKPVTQVHLVSRSTAASARWDPAMLRELAKLKRTSFHVVTGGNDLTASPAGKALAELLAHPATKTSLRVNFYFASMVERVIGTDEVEGLSIVDADGQRHHLSVGTVITAIGFAWLETATTTPRVYPTGWLKTGPRGTIPFQRVLAKQVVTEIISDIQSGQIEQGRPGRSELPPGRSTDFSDWRRIDGFERARAASRRTRQKIRTIDGMFAVAAAEPHRVSQGEDV